jgi:hypothetical protein
MDKKEKENERQLLPDVLADTASKKSEVKKAVPGSGTGNSRPRATKAKPKKS